MTIDPHHAERLILIGCHDAASRPDALRLHLHYAERDFWREQVTTFLRDTVKYETTTCAVFIAPEARDWPEAQEIYPLVREHYKHARINQNTVEAIGARQGANFIRNVRRIAHSGGRVRDARRALPSMAGHTAIVCGAGPSLEEIGSRLTAHSGPIIAVNTSVGACAEHGVIPNVVVCTESKAVTEGVARINRRQSQIAMDMTGHTDNWLVDAIDDQLPQLCFVGTEPNLASYARTLGMLPLAYGASCTTAAVALALACGAKRVVLVGQDCAFMPTSWCGAFEELLPGMPSAESFLAARMYAAGTPYEETRVIIDPTRGRARIDKPTVGALQDVDVVSVPGIDGQGVFTTHGMLSFAQWFSEQPQHVRSRIVNCTTHGARINGIEHCELEHVLERSHSTYGIDDPRHLGDSAARKLAARATKMLRELSDVADVGRIADDATLLECARYYPILAMWTGPERLRLRRMDALSSAERGHRMAETIRTACREIAQCVEGTDNG